MGKCEIKIEKAGSDLKVKVAGIIDEDMDFTAFSLSGATNVELHLENVKGINSCGIREWIKWISTASKAKVSYYECPKIIVDQINMIQGFLPASAKVMSFFVPYFCEKSGEEKNILFTFGKEYSENAVTAPKEVQDSSGNAMEMDVVESKYFKFIKK